MNAFVSLQVMISVEALRTLVALEGSLVLLLLRLSVTAVYLRHAGIARHHPSSHATGAATANQRHLAAGAMQVRHNWSGHGGERIVEGSGVVIRHGCGCRMEHRWVAIAPASGKGRNARGRSDRGRARLGRGVAVAVVAVIAIMIAVAVVGEGVGKGGLMRGSGGGMRVAVEGRRGR